MFSSKKINYFIFFGLILLVNISGSESHHHRQRNKDCYCKKLRILCKLGGEFCKEYRELCKCRKRTTVTTETSTTITTTPQITTTTSGYPDYCEACAAQCGYLGRHRYLPEARMTFTCSDCVPYCFPETTTTTEVTSTTPPITSTTTSPTFPDLCTECEAACMREYHPYVPQVRFTFTCEYCVPECFDLPWPPPTTTTEISTTTVTETFPDFDYCGYCDDVCLNNYNYHLPQARMTITCASCMESCHPELEWPPVSTTTEISTPPPTTTTETTETTNTEIYIPTYCEACEVACSGRKVYHNPNTPQVRFTLPPCEDCYPKCWPTTQSSTTTRTTTTIGDYMY